ncbi:MAG TPA: phytanoyl-CoA dioxygenase family protein [Xanthobacteraceae bacterium]|nr:phytanoyl-CoA dioxygenase family protein [Xanthobacteraceae bacterium]
MPEICTAEQADFSKAWQQNGTAKVAAFLSPQELGELRSAVDASYDLLRQHVDDDPPTLTEYLAHHFKRWDGIWVKELRPYLDGVRPELREQFDSVIAAAERRFRELFDQGWRLEPNFTFVRRHRSTKHYLPWHIDADAAGIINSTDYCINTWLPLDPVGDVLPSLELIPGSNKTMQAVPSREGKEKARPDDWVKANVGGESWIPHAQPGDAILFDHWTLHRTQRMEQENAVRTSCEFRFVRTS